MIAFGLGGSWLRHRMWRSRGRSALLGVLAVGLTVFSAVVARAQAPDQSDLKALGHVPTHGTFSQFPWESIDTQNGNVVLSFTDVVLPGNAGFSLAIQRTWNANASVATG
jgi:hypothetical protein